MTRLARSLGATAALAALVALLGGAAPAAVTQAAKPASPPAPVAPAAAVTQAAKAAPPGPVAPAAAQGAPGARRAPPGSARFESSDVDSFAPPQLFIAWHAPYGTPGATDTISFGAGDSNRVDTLFMSFEIGRNTPQFLGMTARLYFHPANGDTLGTYWRYDSGSPNYRNLEIEFDPDGSFPCPQPWNRSGAGLVDFEFDAGGASLDLTYVITAMQNVIPADGRVRYCFARVMFRQRRWDLPGARQPVCLEWAVSRFSSGLDEATARSGPGRCISMNSPDGSVCVPYRRNPGPLPWAPPRPVIGRP